MSVLYTARFKINQEYLSNKHIYKIIKYVYELNIDMNTLVKVVPNSFLHET